MITMKVMILYYITYIFENTITKENNRYYISWPWRDENPCLPENYALSLGRLKSLYKRFENDPALLEKYDDMIKKQLEKSMIEKIE